MGEEIQTKAKAKTKKTVSNSSVIFWMKTAINYRTILKDGDKRGVIVGENKIIRIDKSDPMFKAKVEFLDKSKQNIKNGGGDFIRIDDLDEVNPDGNIIDKLIELDNAALINMLDKRSDLDLVKSKGILILDILKQQKEL